MYYYQAYGLNICSEVGIFQLPVQNAISEPDLIVSIGSIRIDEPKEALLYPYLKLDQTEVAFAITSLGKFLVRNGNEIIVDPDPGADNSLLQGYLVGASIAILLNQRGRLVLHASALNINGRGVAIMGYSGMGKSSTAASLLARGHTLLTDDIAAIAFSDQGPVVYPGFPHLKLAPEAAQSLHAGDLQLKYMDEFDDKFNYHLLRNAPSKPVTIQQIYILEDGRQVEIGRISGTQAMIEYIRYSMPTSMVKLNPMEHFKKCTRLASSIECYKIKRPRSLDALPKVAEKIEAYVS